jgi:WD40 repeat protein
MPQLGPSAVFSAALSSDGKYVLTSGLASTWLWDANTGRIIRMFKGNAGIFSPDSMYVLTVDSNTTQLWEMETGREVRQFAGRSASFGSAFSADGNYILTSHDNAARLWETKTGQEIRRFEGHSAAVNSATFSPDGKYVVTASVDKTARLWEANTARELGRFEGHSAALISAVCSSNGKYILTTSRDDETVRLWSKETKQEIRRFQRDREEYLLIIPATFSPNGEYVLTASWYTAALLWQTESGKLIRTFPFLGPVYTATFSSDGKYVLIAGIDKTTQLFDVQTRRVINQYGGYSIAIKSVAFSPDGKYILTSDEGGTGHLWGIETGREIRRFKGSSTFVYSAIFSPDGKYVLMPGNDTTAHIFETETGREWPRLKGHSGIVLSAVFSADGTYILTASPDGTARLWEAKTGRQIHKFKAKAAAGDSDVITEASATFSPDEKFVLTEWGWGHNAAQLWEIKTEEEVAQFKGHSMGIASATFSPDQDGKYVLTASFDNTARLWNAKSGRQLLRFEGHTSSVNSAVFSPDGKYVLTAGSDQKAILFETETAHEIRRFEADPDGWGFSAAFSPDGKYVIAANPHNTVWLWETETGRLRGRFEGHPNTFFQDVRKSVALSPDEKYLLTAQEDGTTRFWSVSTGEQLCQFMAFQDGTWNIVTPKGQFDTSDLEESKGLQWIVTDEPLKPLPLEIFMRDYYEPRLLTRLLKGEKLPTLPSLAELNRTQPKIEKVTVLPQSNNPEAVTVKVEAASVVGRCLRGDKHVSCESGVYDLRLYRDGQLVGQYPSEGTNNSSSDSDGQNRMEQLERWRQSSVVKTREGRPITVAAGKQEITFTNIRLPQRANVSQVQFTAYAFNEDRVKSATSDPTVYTLPRKRPNVKPRAYIIAVGVDLTSDPNWHLSFAPTGARELGRLLTEKLQSQYEVVSVPLISEYKEDDAEALLDANKDNIRSALNILSGRDVTASQRYSLPNQEKLRAATPDDLVIFYIASHGYADPSGTFYVVPSDIGEPEGVSENLLNRCIRNSEQSESCQAAREFLRHSISSYELSQWLQTVDAGEMMLILDSCHSAAVSGPTFKPGPMGDRGFGQLSYDKGMMVLTATQAENFAWGALVLRDRSLLTYALTQGQGLEGTLNLKQWLNEAERQVPELYEKFVHVEQKADSPDRYPPQQPMLFDFASKRLNRGAGIDSGAKRFYSPTVVTSR